MRGGAIEGWREVAVAEFGAGEREYVRSGGSMVWRFGAGLMGTGGTVDDAGDIHTLYEAVDHCLMAADGRIRVASDLRRVRWSLPAPAMASALPSEFLPRFERYGRHVDRHAALLPDDWTKPFYSGFFQLYPPPWQWQLFTESGPMWAWLDVSTAEAEEIEAAVAEVLAESSVLSALVRLLSDRPALDLVGASRGLAMSPRSLQRELSRCRTSFAELRTRARADRACALLASTTMKVEAVAAEVGFASAAHFVTWFRAQRGATPSQFREMLGKLGA